MKLLEAVGQKLLGGTLKATAAAYNYLSAKNYALTERLAELELALEDVNWARLVNEGNRELSRDGLKRIMAMARLFFLKNPLINRAVTLQAYYVWGQGINITAKDDAVNEVVQEFMSDPKNKAELTSHQARTMKEMDLQVLGNLFFAFFTDRRTGDVRVRSIPADEILEILTNPEDMKEPWYYKRIWVEEKTDNDGGYKQTSRIAYYPDWQFKPAARERVTIIGGNPVMWDAPVYHRKVGGLSDMRFGVPEVYAALDWAKSYKEFLEDWSTIVRSYARFAWDFKTKGGQAAVAAAKAKLGTTLATSNTVQADTNPPPVAGADFIHSEGVDMKPFKTAGATTAAEDGRRLLLMVCAATGMPESFFGDVSVGTLATAKSLDRPTELKFRDRQTLWADTMVEILEFAVAAKIAAKVLPASIDTTITASFPPILEHEVLPLVQAIVAAATLSGYSQAGTIDPEELSRMLYTALGRTDVDELLARMNFDEIRAAQAAQPQPGDKPKPDDKMSEALHALRGSLGRLLSERGGHAAPAEPLSLEVNVSGPAKTPTKQVVKRDAEGAITEVETVAVE